MRSEYTGSMFLELAIPKHVFVLWLAMRDSLSAGERLMQWGFNGVVMSLYCRSCIEGRDHMFFACGFGKKDLEGGYEEVSN